MDNGTSRCAPRIRRGQCLPDVHFITVDSQQTSLSSFKGRYNLLLVATTNPDSPFLDALGRRQAEIAQRGTVTIAFLACAQEGALRARQRGGWPFLVVSGRDGSVTRRFGFVPQDALTVCITDRWAEVFYISNLPVSSGDAQVDECLNWLDFIEHQCPECFPSEWPD